VLNAIYQALSDSALISQPAKIPMVNARQPLVILAAAAVARPAVCLQMALLALEACARAEFALPRKLMVRLVRWRMNALLAIA
jgi:hypothetical protein